MRLHPRESVSGPLFSRRRLLQLGALAAVAGTGALAGCGRERNPVSSASIELSRPGHPVRLPLHADVPAIADGLAPETGGVLKIFNYAEYLNPDLVTAFGQEHGVEVEVTTFVTQDEALAKLATPGLD